MKNRGVLFSPLSGCATYRPKLAKSTPTPKSLLNVSGEGTLAVCSVCVRLHPDEVQGRRLLPHH